VSSLVAAIKELEMSAAMEEIDRIEELDRIAATDDLGKIADDP
jgi:hypothetical protein